jgi:hypothetical protein
METSSAQEATATAHGTDTSSAQEAMATAHGVKASSARNAHVPLETSVPMETKPPLSAPVAAGIGSPMVLQQKGAPSLV